MSNLYKTYMFRDKDPVIDVLRTIMDKERLDLNVVAADAGVAVTTITAWLYGITRRPQHATVMAVCRAMGYDYKMVKMRAHGNVVEFTTKQR
jgi:hypothetical protein